MHPILYCITSWKLWGALFLIVATFTLFIGADGAEGSFFVVSILNGLVAGALLGLLLCEVEFGDD